MMNRKPAENAVITCSHKADFYLNYYLPFQVSFPPFPFPSSAPKRAPPLTQSVLHHHPEIENEYYYYYYSYDTLTSDSHHGGISNAIERHKNCRRSQAQKDANGTQVNVLYRKDDDSTWPRTNEAHINVLYPKSNSTRFVPGGSRFRGLCKPHRSTRPPQTTIMEQGPGPVRIHCNPPTCTNYSGPATTRPVSASCSLCHHNPRSQNPKFARRACEDYGFSCHRRLPVTRENVKSPRHDRSGGKHGSSRHTSSRSHRSGSGKTKEDPRSRHGSGKSYAKHSAGKSKSVEAAQNRNYAYSPPPPDKYGEKSTKSAKTAPTESGPPQNATNSHYSKHHYSKHEEKADSKPSSGGTQISEAPKDKPQTPPKAESAPVKVDPPPEATSGYGASTSKPENPPHVDQAALRSWPEMQSQTGYGPPQPWPSMPANFGYAVSKPWPQAPLPYGYGSPQPWPQMAPQVGYGGCRAWPPPHASFAYGSSKPWPQGDPHGYCHSKPWSHSQPRVVFADTDSVAPSHVGYGAARHRSEPQVGYGASRPGWNPHHEEQGVYESSRPRAQTEPHIGYGAHYTKSQNEAHAGGGYGSSKSWPHANEHATYESSKHRPQGAHGPARSKTPVKPYVGMSPTPLVPQIDAYDDTTRIVAPTKTDTHVQMSIRTVVVPNQPERPNSGPIIVEDNRRDSAVQAGEYYSRGQPLPLPERAVSRRNTATQSYGVMPARSAYHKEGGTYGGYTSHKSTKGVNTRGENYYEPPPASSSHHNPAKYYQSKTDNKQPEPSHYYQAKTDSKHHQPSTYYHQRANTKTPATSNYYGAQVYDKPPEHTNYYKTDAKLPATYHGANTPAAYGGGKYGGGKYGGEKHGGDKYGSHHPRKKHSVSRYGYGHTSRKTGDYYHPRSVDIRTHAAVGKGSHRNYGGNDPYYDTDVDISTHAAVGQGHHPQGRRGTPYYEPSVDISTHAAVGKNSHGRHRADTPYYEPGVDLRTHAAVGHGHRGSSRDPKTTDYSDPEVDITTHAAVGHNSRGGHAPNSKKHQPNINVLTHASINGHEPQAYETRPGPAGGQPHSIEGSGAASFAPYEEPFEDDSSPQRSSVPSARASPVQRAIGYECNQRRSRQSFGRKSGHASPVPMILGRKNSRRESNRSSSVKSSGVYSTHDYGSRLAYRGTSEAKNAPLTPLPNATGYENNNEESAAPEASVESEATLTSDDVTDLYEQQEEDKMVSAAENRGQSDADVVKSDYKSNASMSEAIKDASDVGNMKSQSDAASTAAESTPQPLPREKRSKSSTSSSAGTSQKTEKSQPFVGVSQSNVYGLDDVPNQVPWTKTSFVNATVGEPPPSIKEETIPPPPAAADENEAPPPAMQDAQEEVGKSLWVFTFC